MSTEKTPAGSAGDGGLDVATQEFMLPKKEVFSPVDVQDKWEKSEVR